MSSQQSSPQSGPRSLPSGSGQLTVRRLPEWLADALGNLRRASWEEIEA